MTSPGSKWRWLILLFSDVLSAFLAMVVLNGLSGLLLAAFIVEIVVALIPGLFLLKRHAGDMVVYRWHIKNGENVTLEESSNMLMFLLGFSLAMPGLIAALMSLILSFPPGRQKIAKWLTARYTRAEAVIIDASLNSSSGEGDLK